MSVEIWVPIRGFEGVYTVSNLGRVCREKFYRSTQVGKILKPALDGKGYLTVVLYLDELSSRWRVHRLVAEAFCGVRQADHVINHKDGKKENNFAVNLEFVTRSENTNHAYRNGLIKIPVSENCSAAKLTRDDVSGIRDRLKAGWNQGELAKIYKVSQTTISKIYLGKTWK